MAELDTAPQPRRVVTEVVARCANCKRPLYAETIAEELIGGELVELERSDSGALVTCPCREAPA